MEAYLVPSIGSLAAFSRPVSLKLSGFFLELDLPSRILITIQKSYSNSGTISPEDLVQALGTLVFYIAPELCCNINVFHAGQRDTIQQPNEWKHCFNCGNACPHTWRLFWSG
jgi:hypothetical protein